MIFPGRTKVFLFFLHAVWSVLLFANVTFAQTPDPLEPMNRGIFWFNQKFDDYLLGPVAKGYKWVLPKPARDSVGNFFENIAFPVYLVSDVLQLKFEQAGIHSARFVINSTIGVGGLFDLAESEFDLEHHPEDTGSAFGNWGIGEGFYLVIPFMGPTNARDGIGRIADGFLNPLNYFAVLADDGEYVTYGFQVLGAIDTRARLDEGLESAKDTSLDYYAFIRSTYHQVRQNVIYDNNPPDDETPEYEEEVGAGEKTESNKAVKEDTGKF